MIIEAPLHHFGMAHLENEIRGGHHGAMPPESGRPRQGSRTGQRLGGHGRGGYLGNGNGGFNQGGQGPQPDAAGRYEPEEDVMPPEDGGRSTQRSGYGGGSSRGGGHGRGGHGAMPPTHRSGRGNGGGNFLNGGAEEFRNDESGY